MEEFSNAYFELGNDIDLRKTSFTPIKSGETGFSGVLDGKGYSIKYMKISDTKNAGFFEAIGTDAKGNTGTVKNIVFENADITAKNNAGIVAAQLNGIVKNVQIKNSSVSGKTTGGITGVAEEHSVITECSSDTKVTGTQLSGGLAGQMNDGTIELSFVNGEVGGNLSADKGALVGTYTINTDISDAKKPTVADIKNSYWDENAEQKVAGIISDDVKFSNSVGLIDIVVSQVSKESDEGSVDVISAVELPELRFTSSDKKILTVDKDGDYTPISDGESNITIKLSNTDVQLGTKSISVEDMPAPTSEETSSSKATSEETTSSKATSEETTSSKTTSEETTSSKATSEETTSSKATSEETTSSKATSEETSSSKAESQDTSTPKPAVGNSADKKPSQEVETALNGWVEEGGNTYYYIDGVSSKKFAEIDGKTYYFSWQSGIQLFGWFAHDNGATKYYADPAKNGEIVKNEMRTINDNTYLFTETGKVAKGIIDFNANTYYFDPITGAGVTGIISLDATTHYYADPAKGGAIVKNDMVTVGGKTYLFTENGTAAKKFAEFEGKTYYFSWQSGIQITGWFAHDNGLTKYYADPDKGGEIVKNEMRTINDKNYIFTENGKVAKGFVTKGENTYYFDPITGAGVTGVFSLDATTHYYADPAANGAIVKNDMVTIGGKTYLFTENGMAAKQFAEFEGNSYYFSWQSGIQIIGWFAHDHGLTKYYADPENGGQIVKNEMRSIDGVSYIFTETGKVANSKGFIEFEGNTFFFDPATGQNVQGFFSLDATTHYYADPALNGAIVKNKMLTLDGNTYLFTANGQAAKRFAEFEGKTYYFSWQNGIQLTGWFAHDNGLTKYYADPAKGGELVKNEMRTINNVTYLFTESGKVAKGLVNYNASTYYFDPITGAGATGIFSVNGAVYYADPANGGALVKDKMLSVNGKNYLFSKTGAAAKGLVEYNANTYYFDPITGAGATGIISLDATTHYYADPAANGAIVKNDMVTVDGKTYLFTENGTAAKQFAEFEGKSYYFSWMSGVQIIGFFTQDNGLSKYYADPANGGQIVKNEMRTIDGVSYIFTETGKVANSKGFIEFKGKTYYFDPATGQNVQGLFSLDATTHYYADPADGGAIVKNDMRTINGKTYLFTANGQAAKRFADFEGKTYYFSWQSGVQITGWFAHDEGLTKYYADPAKGGELVKNEMRTIDKSTYLFTETGKVAKGLVDYEGKTFYFDLISGVQAKGFFSVDISTHYYADPAANGVIVKNDMLTIEGKTYLFTANGQAAKSFAEFEGKTYYFSWQSGVQIMGWFAHDNGLTRYYADPAAGGEVVKNILRVVDGDKYFFTATGAVQKEFLTIGDDLYHFDHITGAAKRGWFSTKYGSQCYADPASNICYNNGWATIAGVRYYFHTDGRYIAPPKIGNVSYSVSGRNAIVTIAATSASPATIAGYSWDSGASWVSTNQKTYTLGTTINGGTLMVKDSLGQITVYNADTIIESGAGPYKGIDVSSHQGPINWSAVKASGVDYAIIRALSWNTSTNYYGIDPYFETNVRNAKANGIKVGAYIFSHAFSTAEIAEEVNVFHNSAQMNNLRRDGIKFDYPVYIDYEWNGVLEHTHYASRTEIVRVGMALLENYGYYPGFYTYHSFAQLFDAKGLHDMGYDFWYARYVNNPNPAGGTIPHLGWSAEMWQYTSSGTVPGISGPVDMNMGYVDYSKIINGSPAGGGEVAPTMSVYDLNTSKVVTGSIEDIVAGIVANEVNSFHNSEVNKAQAVTAYSWLLYQQQQGSTAPSVGLKPASATIKADVKAVSGQRVMYNGSVAQTVYGSASGAMTNTSRDMWGFNLPYLNAPVSSPESMWRNRTGNPLTVTRTDGNRGMYENVVKVVGKAKADATPHSQWVTNMQKNSNGYLTSVQICGKTISANKFYESFWGFVSPGIVSLTYNGGNDTWNLTTNGNGHCVGMSQYGAKAMADSGYNYAQIVSHYFPGTTIS